MDRDDDWNIRLPFEPIPLSRDLARIWDGRPTFDDAIESAAVYHRRIAGRAPQSKVELARELEGLLAQLDFVLKGAYVLHEQYWRLNATTERGSLDWPMQRRAAFGLEFFASVFYYLAHRAQKIVSDKKFPLPGFESYREAIGVRHTRNSIIEHPRAEEFIGSAGFAVHSVYGPRTRTGRDGKPITSDPQGWLFADAAEFASTMTQALARAGNSLLAIPPAERPPNER